MKYLLLPVVIPALILSLPSTSLAASKKKPIKTVEVFIDDSFDVAEQTDLVTFAFRKMSTRLPVHIKLHSVTTYPHIEVGEDMQIAWSYAETTPAIADYRIVLTKASKFSGVAKKICATEDKDKIALVRGTTIPYVGSRKRGSWMYEVSVIQHELLHLLGAYHKDGMNIMYPFATIADRYYPPGMVRIMKVTRREVRGCLGWKYLK